GTVRSQVVDNNFGRRGNLSGALATSSAVCSLAPVGHTIKALYSGDTSFITSTATFTQSINRAGTSTTLTSSASTSVYGQSITFTAMVSITAPGVGTPAGTVQFMIDGGNAGSPVNVGTIGGRTTASFSTPSMGV